eukprot:5385521-Karenia_brevis.AAC.1
MAEHLGISPDSEGSACRHHYDRLCQVIARNTEEELPDFDDLVKVPRRGRPPAPALPADWSAQLAQRQNTAAEPSANEKMQHRKNVLDDLRSTKNMVYGKTAGRTRASGEELVQIPDNGTGLPE